MAKNNSKKIAAIDFSELRHQSETLLANIRFASLDEPVKTVVITSSMMDEGKSTMAISLATAMAKAGKRTLIMDCDMRRRSLGKMMNLHPEGGIYSLLSGQMPLKKALSATSTPNLYFLDCEPNIANPSEVLSTKRFATLMKTLRGTFDYVVIDTPPLSLFVDAAVASTLADGVVLVVRQRKAKKRAVADALAQLRAANARVLGLALTFAQKGDEDYYYYYYYNEENKRVKKKRSRDEKGSVQEQTLESRREFDKEDVTAWARRVGVGVDTTQEQERANKGDRHPERAETTPPKNSRNTAGVREGRGITVPTVGNSFTPGAFKK